MKTINSSLLILSFVFLIPNNIFAQELTKEGLSKRSLWQDTKTTFWYMVHGSYEQFLEPNNLYYAAVGIPATWYTFNIDRKFQDKVGPTKVTSFEDLVSDSGVVLNTPVFPLAMWYLGKKTGNSKLMQFSMEVAATTYLTLLESSILSRVQIHHRPNSSDLSPWETDFRGDSSWPSGHVVPYFALMFKTFQFYGPYWALVPAALAGFASAQRIKDDKHWLSDVTGAFFLTAFASEGIRRVAKYKDNHPIYKWIFEHEVQVGVVRHKKSIGPRLVWNF